MKRQDRVAFVLGRDYHLGDLLWFTAVLAEYRRQRSPEAVTVSLPETPVRQILDQNPLIDDIEVRTGSDGFGNRSQFDVVHDLRIPSMAISMIRQWPRRRPWLYYRDLWMQPRGQWLATYLGLGQMSSYRPILVLEESELALATELPDPYVVLAPHIGSYSVPLMGTCWQRIKGWEWEKWEALAAGLRSRGLTPVTLAAAAQRPIAGSEPLLGLPIRRAAAVIARSAALVSGESGLWFVAGACDIPFVIVPWWLPKSVDWPGAMAARAKLVRREEASPERVVECLSQLGVGTGTSAVARRQA